MKTCLPLPFLLLICALLPLTASAQKKPGEAVKVHETKIKGAAAPGGEVTAVLVFEIDQGYHTHSNKPSEPNFIPTVLTIQVPKGVTAGPPVYPKGKSEKVKGLDKPLSVYEGQFTISVPLKLDSSVKLPLNVPAALRYQACQGAQCYAPKTLNMEISVSEK
jgi:DsbC/DsbD-like thiol-disulfide interchange protein